MSGFTEAWLRDYEGKRRGSAVSKLFTIRFTMSRPTMLLNELLRLHFRQRARYAARLSSEIAQLTRDLCIDAPFARAVVSIERFSVGEPDHDGLVGGCKPLVDCLLPRSQRHPHGLGFVQDDSPAHMTLRVSHVKSPTLKGQGTTVTIEREAP